jgi:hypothetical protein
MVEVISLIIGAVGLLFGFYQWGRQQGKVRVVILEEQGRLRATVIVDAPNSIHVQGLALDLGGNKGRVRRLLQMWWNAENMNRRQRIAAMWRFRDFDMGGRWLTPTTPDGGPSFPAEITGYSDASWVLIGINYAPEFQDLLTKFSSVSPRIRFRAALTGHPRRMVRSRWRPLASLDLLAERNSWLLRVEDGLPQPNLGMSLDAMFDGPSGDADSTG